MKNDLSAFSAYLAAAGFPEPTPEYRFHDERKWRFDLAWPLEKLAFEREGGVYAGGRHTRGSGYSGDIEKYNEAAIAGWLVIRATPAQIRTGEALDWLTRAMNMRLAGEAPK